MVRMQNVHSYTGIMLDALLAYYAQASLIVSMSMTLCALELQQGSNFLGIA